MFSITKSAFSLIAFAAAGAAAGKGNTDKADNFKSSIVTRIDEVKAADGVTAKILGPLCNDMLIYVPETGDIGMVNRLLKSLHKANRNMCFLFFAAFLPWKPTEDGLFGEKMSGGKRVDNIDASRIAFTAGKGTVWTWEKAKREVAPRTDADKRVSALKRITSAVTTATKDFKATPAEIMAVVQAAGISVDAIIEFAHVMEEAKADAKTAQTPGGETVDVPPAHVIDNGKGSKEAAAA